NRTHDAIVRSAAADIAIKRRRDLGAGGRGIAVEQRLGRDQYAREAIPALPRLLVEKCCLQGMRALRRPQALDGRDVLVRDAPQRLGAGFLRLAIDEDHAASALLQSASEPGTLQVQVIA